MATKHTENGTPTSPERGSPGGPATPARTDQPLAQPWSSGSEHLGSPARPQRGRFYSAAMDRSSSQRPSSRPPALAGRYGSSREAGFDRGELPGYLSGSRPGGDDRLGPERGYGERLAAGYGNDTGFAAEGRFEPEAYDPASAQYGIRRRADQDERFEDRQASLRSEWSPRERTDLGDRAIGFTPGRSVGTSSGVGPLDRGYPNREERRAADTADYREGRRANHQHRTPGGTQNTRSQGGPLMGLDTGPVVHRNRGSGLLDRVTGRWEREGLTAREVMTRGVKTIRPEATLREVAQLMETEDVGVVPVCDANNRLLGIVTDRDLVVRAFKEDRSPSSLAVRDVMTEDIEAVTPDESVHDVIELMATKQIRRVPVVDKDDRLLGIISLGDIATRADFDEDLQEALQRISGRRSFWSRMFT